MRSIGYLNDPSQARLFGDFLFSQSIDNQIERESDGRWAVWVLDEEQLETAMVRFAEFRADPGAERFALEASRAETLRAEIESKEKAARARHLNADELLARSARSGPLTLTLIAVSVAVMAMTMFGWGRFVESYLYISAYVRGLPEIREGQVWRLITPIFIHGDLLHIAFNMMWLHFLGNLIERRFGFLSLLTLTLTFGVASNLGQYWASGPAFCGMSGVNYGLMAYVWLRGKFDPRSGLFLHPNIVALMLVWYFVCLFGIVPGVANAAHTVGLASGAFLGWAAAQRKTE